MPSSRTSWAAVAAAVTTLTASVNAVGWDCANIVKDGVHWNLKPLSGVHSVSAQWEEAPLVVNWTYALDLCNPLPKEKNVDDKHQCPQNTHICASKREHEPDKEDDGLIKKWIAIAGKYTMATGAHLEVKPERLKNAQSNTDASREGLRLEWSGGSDPFGKKKNSVKQRAVVELICNKEKTGWEPAEPPKTKRDEDKEKDGDDKKDDGGEKEEDPNQALKFLSYVDEDVRGEVWGTLRLEWQTKYACEDAIAQPGQSKDPKEDDGNTSGGWGFFTWLILILFLGIAAYVIFGSWLNYTRYGARGLDLVPHADTIRDIPYIVKDMFRRAQGGGSRGGYSAV